MRWFLRREVFVANPTGQCELCNRAPAAWAYTVHTPTERIPADVNLDAQATDQAAGGEIEICNPCAVLIESRRLWILQKRVYWPRRRRRKPPISPRLLLEHVQPGRRPLGIPSETQPAP